MEARYKKLMANALHRIGELQEQLEVSQRDAKDDYEPIAIIGLGCRFPGGADRPETFWQNLCAGTDTVSDVPKDRWDVDAYFDPAREAKGKTYCRQASFIDDVYDFDPQFFGISPREALMMDPQQRLLLEITWQTFENAKIPPQQLRGSNTGVFVGTMSYDFLQTLTRPSHLDLHSATGVALSVASGRLSYFLDFQGPTLTLDTACSSSLVAVDLACQSLRSKECDLSLAGGVNVMTSPLMGVSEAAANMLAPDGRCKTFDASADGYGRGEGCGMILLKRLSDAVADKDSIVAVIRGSAVNHDGQSSGLTVPNPQAQMSVIKTALHRAKVKPEQVSYVEAHGTGTPLGDPIEIGGLDSVYCRDRTPDSPLVVGSVKANIGHLEGAAGIAALIKTALVVQHGKIPPHQHFNEPNPHVDWGNIAIEIPKTKMSWPNTEAPRLAGVSSFGFSGTNAHIILEQAPNPTEVSDPALTAASSDYLLTVSAKTKAALKQAVRDHLNFIESHTNISIKDICYSTNTTRNHFEHRFAASVCTGEDALEKLKAFDPSSADASLGQKQRGAVFVFPKCDHIDDVNKLMAQARELYDRESVFKASFDAVAKQAVPQFERPLQDAFEGLQNKQQSTAFGRAARFAVQYGLAELWKSWGIQAVSTLGEQDGRYVAACIAGVFGVGQVLTLISGDNVQDFNEPEIPCGSANVTQHSYWKNLQDQPDTFSADLKSLSQSGDALQLTVGARSLRDDLGKMYVAGLNPDWVVMHQNTTGNRVALPNYPFQRKTYRVPVEATHFLGRENAEKTHPLLGAHQSDHPHVWQGKIETSQTAWLKDHRIGQQSIFPGVAYVDMVICAFRSLHADHVAKISSIDFEQPLFLDGDLKCDLKTELTKAADGGYAFVISSRTQNQPWTRHVVGEIGQAAKPKKSIALDTLLDGFAEEREGQDFYQAWAERGNHWQGVFQGIDKVWKKDKHRIARISVPSSLKDQDLYFAHPAIMDACGHVLADFALEGEQSGQFMVKKVGEASFYGPLAGKTLWSHVTLHEDQSDLHTLSGSLTILDKYGTVLVDVKDCSFAFVEGKKELDEKIQNNLYVVDWTDIKLTNTHQFPTKNWLILSDKTGFAEQLEKALTAKHYKVYRDDLGGISGSEHPVHVVDLRGLDLCEMHEGSVLQGANAAAALSQTVADLRGLTSAKIFLVTQGAWDRAPQQAIFWGLGRTLALEQSSVWGGLVDIDTGVDFETSAKQLVGLLDQDTGEDQIRLHGGKALAARLNKRPGEQVFSPPPVLDKKASYLITGGLGAIGLQMAHTLAERGAGTLILMARTRLPSRSEWAQVDPKTDLGEKIKAIQVLESLGATVVTAGVDVSDAQAVDDWYTAFKADQKSPVKGVVHAAGFADHTPFLDLDAAAMTAHLAPKMGGAIVLDRCLENEPLDFFVMLSSASALLSSPLLAAYAAANAFLDAFVLQRRQQGKPGLSVAWGPWQDAGMADDGFAQSFKAIRAVSASDALELMDNLWNSSAEYLAVLPIDWQVWLRHYPSAANVPLLADVLQGLGQEIDLPALSDFQENLLEGPLDERTERLLAWLSEKVAEIFATAHEDLSLDEPLNVQGMDSLMALEIRNVVDQGLNLDLDIMDLMQGISIRELAALLAQRVNVDVERPLVVENTNQSVQFPVTHGQQALWLIHELAPESSAYNVAFALSLKSPIETSNLKNKFSILVNRHSALRSVMIKSDEQVVQRVLADTHFGFEVIDAAGWDEQRLKDEVALAYARPFDLGDGPVFRVHLFSQGPKDHVLLLVAHHMVCDGWSLWILIEEFEKLCKSDNVLSTMASQYSDYVQRQDQLLKGPNGDRLRAFWKDTLKGELPVLNLPTDRPRPLVQSYQGATCSFLLPKDLTNGLRALARKSGVTDYMVLLAAYNVLLHRYTGQSELLVGCPTAGRSSADFSGVVGHFVNPVVMRSRLSGELSFDDFLLQTRDVVMNALAHQDYPFSLIVENIQACRNPGHSPIFQTDFTLQRPQQSQEIIDMMMPEGLQEAPLTWGDLDLMPYEVAQQEGQFDLSLEVIETQNRYFCSLKYNTDLFDATTMDRMAKHFELLLGEIVKTPQQNIAALNMVTQDERKMLLHQFNDTKADYPTNTTLQELFEHQVKKTPKKIAIVCGDGQLTYGEVNKKANQIAALLKALDIKTGDFVGVLEPRGTDFLVSILGVLKAGGAYVPIDPDYPTGRIHHMIEDSQVKVLISRTECVASSFPSSALQHVILLDGELKDTPSLKFHGAKAIAEQSERNRKAVCGATDRAYMIYTSGSTGAPKGAIIRHNGALNHIFAQFEAMSFHYGSVFLQSAPSSSDISVWQFLAPLLIGGRTVVADFATVCSAQSLFALIQNEQVTVIELVPAVLEALVDHMSHASDRNLEALEWAMVTGEAVSVDLVNRWFETCRNIPLVNAYGPTEAADDICQYILRAPLAPSTHNVPIGAPLGNLSLYVLDENLQLVPLGVSGEICVSGIGVGEGYWQNPEKTAESFVANPYVSDGKGDVLYRTGDQGRWLADGNLEFLGRDDEQVKIRGYRIELGEIESVLVQHPDVRQALAMVWEEPTGQKRLVAYILSNGSLELSQSTLRNFAGDFLPDHMVPTSCVFLDAFPLLPNGKVDKKSLPAPERIEAGPQAPLSSSQSRILSIWKDVLDRDAIGVHSNFFELGGHSLLMSTLHSRIEKEFDVQFPLVTMWQYPTVGALAKFIDPGEAVKSMPLDNPDCKVHDVQGSNDIAIIGMSCRFAGAENIEAYWQNLRDKVESVSFFEDAELLDRGADADLIKHPDFVKGCATLDGMDMFDARFFGFNAREAEIMDPQQRLFLECAWESLEHAGYHPDNTPDMLVGCFAGQGATAYLTNNVHPNLDSIDSSYLYQVEISNDKDYLATNAGYKLNLKGPCVTVQSACSTSLVAVHMACKSLLDGECDMALAGSVTANVLHQSGYLYQEDMILSPDGHCRPFDKDSQGTIPGSGLGVVTLKRLDQALADGDTIHAVIKGSAVNNDGSLKAGYTAPSVEGQVNVLTKAYASAGIDPQTITYLAAHGTATAMGDSIEIAALSQVFKANPKTCALGSVKANIGHTDTAAGVASLIATVMAMKNKQIPPLANFNEANPSLDFSQTPFYVNSKVVAWEPKNMVRRAGVSSLGIGGTNVHLILEEAPVQAVLKPDDKNRPMEMLVLSAETPTALAAGAKNLADFLENTDDVSLRDVAYTLAVGRKPFAHRQVVLCQDKKDAILKLSSKHSFAGHGEQTDRPVTFMFSGQGAQYVNMGRELYDTEPVFKQTVDAVLEQFEGHLDLDIRSIVFPKNSQAEDVKINQTLIAQPLLFTFEYATTKLLSSWGLQPDSMIGHSIGEYVAACVAGVFSLEDAILLVSKRARLMQDLPAGSMTAVQMTVQQITPYLSPDLSLAAVNSSRLLVVSGEEDAIERFEHKLQGEAKVFTRLHTSHAFHCATMDLVQAPFIKAVKSIRLKAPRVPFVSNLSGTWITDEQATDPNYWFQHLRQTVKFADGLNNLLNDTAGIFLELGPGSTLCTFALQHELKRKEHMVLGCHPPIREKASGAKTLYKTIAKLWVEGVDVDWNGFYQGRNRRRVALPTYAFDRQRYWVDASKAPQKKQSKDLGSSRLSDVGEWTSVPSWQRCRAEGPMVADDFGPWLIFADTVGFADQLIEHFHQQGRTTIMVRQGDTFAGNLNEGYTVNPNTTDHYGLLFDALAADGFMPKGVVHFWGYAKPCKDWNDDVDGGLTTGFSSLFHISKELGRRYNGDKTLLKVVFSDTQDVNGEEFIDPIKASVVGLMKVIGQEYPGVLCQSLDFAFSAKITAQRVAQLLGDLNVISKEPLIAFRGKFRWAQRFEPLYLPLAQDQKTGLKKGGVYLITGGFGTLGFMFAKHLAKTAQAKLVLIGRTPLFEREHWDAWLDDGDQTDRTSQNILKIRELEDLGAEVLAVSCDVADAGALQNLVKAAVKYFGRIDGVIHAAGVTDQDFPIEDMDEKIYAPHFDPKIKGVLSLDRALDGLELDFCVLFSSLSAVLGGLRFAPYASANTFIDSYTQLRNRTADVAWTSIGWDGWQGDPSKAAQLDAVAVERDKNTIRQNEGLDLFQRILNMVDRPDHLIVSVTPLCERIEKWILLKEPEQYLADTGAPQSLYQRPDIATPFVAPQSEKEKDIGKIWQSLLGIDEIGIHDNFFELGGHSLLGTQLISRLRQRYRVEMNIGALFDNPTIDGLAQFVETQGAPDDDEREEFLI